MILDLVSLLKHSELQLISQYNLSDAECEAIEPISQRLADALEGTNQVEAVIASFCFLRSLLKAHGYKGHVSMPGVDEESN